MNKVGTTKSWNNKTQKDCFGFTGSTDIDHIWPTSLGGSNIAANKQKITAEANKAKAKDTSGVVGDYRFSVLKKVLPKDNAGTQHSYGVMYIKKTSSTKDEWLEVIPVV